MAIEEFQGLGVTQKAMYVKSKIGLYSEELNMAGVIVS
jgi:hypothetical protein